MTVTSMQPFYTGNGKGYLRYWCQHALPAVYDDSLSYYELLCKVVAKVNEIVEIHNQENNNWEEIQKRLDEIEAWIKEFQEHGLDPYYEAQVEKWVTENLDFIFRKVVKQVFFGLNRDGYFVAYVPDSWNDIIFDTGWNFGDANYGRLILRWDVDSVHHVFQQPETAEEKAHGNPVQTYNTRPQIGGE